MKKLPKSDWKWYLTLDEVAETIGGVPEVIYQLLWSLMVDTPQEEYPDQRFESPNIIARHIDALGPNVVKLLNELYRRDQEIPVTTCSDCGRVLTDEESVAAGIGPICANR